jgi:hypothetical protein
VIDFDSEENVSYFSDLWRGDPPMAPVNPGYSTRVAEVRNAILFQRSSILETVSVIVRNVSLSHASRNKIAFLTSATRVLYPGFTGAEVRNAILFRLACERDTFLTITDTVSRIDDLWKGILKDDFVHSFRNSLELKAYSSVEREYHRIIWELDKFQCEYVLSCFVLS